LTGIVVFYQLTRKFVHSGQDIPVASKQLIHYTLAIGHHIGIIDCFASKLELSFDGYLGWIAHLPDGEARHKMEGLARFGEIEISAGHAAMLQAAWQVGLAGLSAEEADWTARLNSMLQSIVKEPALYLMVKRS
jgi:hypothetical protein